MTSEGAALFGSLALEVVPRILGLCDRDAQSQSFGCCDRPFWHYRTTDTLNGRAQESGWLFALLAAKPNPQGSFAAHPRLREWSRSAWHFWLRSRNRDGSISEVYPNERSFCATSFTAAAFLQSVLLLGGPEQWVEELESFRPTIRWLDKSANRDIGNQLAASLEAIAAFAAITGEREFGRAAERHLDMLRNVRDSRGFFDEYGGIDLGYQSITMASLVRTLPLLRDGGDTEALLKKSAYDYLERCDEFGRWDPSKNSRMTQFLYPSSFATLCPEFIERAVAGFNAGVLLTPAWLDDRYCVALAIDHLLTFHRLSEAVDG